MADFNKETKQHLLGNMGEHIVQRFLLSKKLVSSLPINVVDSVTDIIIYPNYPDMEETVCAQIKTKAPWAIKNAQSFTPQQWNRYIQLETLFIVCAPLPNSVKHLDKWAGNIYKINPRKVSTRMSTTNNGRDMILVSLTDLTPLHTITDKNILDLMGRLVTEED